jgi:hypothetical protein
MLVRQSFLKALFLNFVAFIRKIQCFIPPFLEERTSLRKDAPKQANYEELAYDEKTTIYTKTANFSEDGV